MLFCCISMTKTIEYVRKTVEENVNRSGYSLELYLHSFLSKNDYLVKANDYFFDHHKNESRSIDLVVDIANYMAGPPDKRVDFVAQMAIECKKNENNAWVFFEVDNEYTLSSHGGHFIDHKMILRNTYQYQCVLWDFNPNMQMHYGLEDDYGRMAISYKVVRKGKEPSNNNN